MFRLRKVIRVDRRSEEFVKRAGFVLIAKLAVHNMKIVDNPVAEFLPVIKIEATDDRDYWKIVNWILR